MSNLSSARFCCLLSAKLLAKHACNCVFPKYQILFINRQDNRIVENIHKTCKPYTNFEWMMFMMELQLFNRTIKLLYISGYI